MREAKKDQGTDLYPGIDDWKSHTLKAGTIITQLDYRSENYIKENKNDFVSNYFSDIKSQILNITNSLSARDLSE